MCLDPLTNAHKPIFHNLGVESPAERAVGVYEDFFELTHQGEALNLNEFAAWIADTRESLWQVKREGIATAPIA